MLIGGAQHRALPRYQSEEMKLLNISFPQMGIKIKTSPQSHVYSRTLESLRYDWPRNRNDGNILFEI